ncbi:MAG: hypothetical protein VKK04_07985 [Synechococcales bacterium]|nr:hypothetical protein [Synechococcales bacterium]
MRYKVQLDGRQAGDEQDNRYAMEVYADHSQAAKTIAYVTAQSAGIQVDSASIDVSVAGVR